MKYIYHILIMTILLTGCITDFDMKLDKLEPRLVVDALITNQSGPYYVRLTKSHTGNLAKIEHTYIDNAVAVKNATIVISDNVGQVDTLLPVSYNPNQEFITPERGYYKTNTIKGIAGRTYYLRIVTEAKEYNANCYMPEVPKIDSLTYKVEKGEIGKSDNYIPILYFKEPKDKTNYYLINHFENKNYIDKGHAGGFLWRYSILSDEFLESYVNGLNIENGSTPNDLGYYNYFAGSHIHVRLNSLTKKAFLYYKTLLEQFEFDGGIYKPTPASPPTNISNGALGFFRASAVSEKYIKIPKAPLIIKD